MKTRDAQAHVDVALDNDVLMKTICFGIANPLWPIVDGSRQVGALGAARYVLAHAIKRTTLSRDKGATLAEVIAFLDTAVVLEPSDREVALAADFETLAQTVGLFLDAGESQLTAMVVARGIAEFATGDKRAIRSLEELLDVAEALQPISGRVRCLEQLVLHVLQDESTFPALAHAVCGEPEVDRTMSICFGCYSESAVVSEAAMQGLESYLHSVRAMAPRVLTP
jgi:hypothetical protein